MNPSLFQAFREQLSFPLDDFQIAGCQALEDGRGVLVCAPTGAGKTVVGEFAVFQAYSQGTKCFYTTPIKALSNQKFHELTQRYGSEHVGLLTGDVSINHDADILVMTTEVLRNMIYAQSDTLARLSHVVMDEIHFLSDKSRGAVWEEAILGLDPEVRLVGLSATVSNSEEFGDWLRSVRGDTEVIVSEHRPIPLNQFMLVGRKIHPLFETGSDRLNPRLKENIQRMLGAEEHNLSGFRSRQFRTRREHNASARGGQARNLHEYRPPSRPDVVGILRSQEMLPAIFFVFSRTGCDAAFYQCMRGGLVLTTEAEATKIAQIVDKGVEGIPEEDLKVLDFRRWKAGLQRGIAAHHAGMLPAFRHIVEKLFVQGLVKVVFATETLALGINMPARTVVLEKLIKFNGESHVELTPGQYTQLTGRAGRRGIDTIGNAVVMWAPTVDPDFVAGLASTRTYPLISTFSPGYNMAVNLLKTIGFKFAHRLLEQSFAQYQADKSVVSEVREIAQAEQQEAKLRAELDTLVAAANPASTTPVEDLLEYLCLRRELSQKEKSAQHESVVQRDKEVRRVLARLQLGTVIALAGKKHPILAVVVSQANNSVDPRPWIVMESGWSGRLGAEAVAMPPMELGRIRLRRKVIENPRKYARLALESLDQAEAAGELRRPRKMATSQRHRPTKEITALREAIRAHEVHAWADREQLARVGERLLKAQRTTAFLATKISDAKDTLGRTFDRILDMLSELDYVERQDGVPVVTDEGNRLARIHSESDLLIAQCLKRGVWDGLDPAELAGLVSMCSFENRKETRGSAEGATETMVAAMNATLRIWEELSEDERRHNLPVSKYPEAGFALAIHQWAAGAPLGYCMAAANECGAELTPGDFVRQARQVVDLLEQVRLTAYQDDTARAARQAIDAIRRGVVSLGE